MFSHPLQHLHIFPRLAPVARSYPRTDSLITSFMFLVILLIRCDFFGFGFTLAIRKQLQNINIKQPCLLTHQSTSTLKNTTSNSQEKSRVTKNRRSRDVSSAILDWITSIRGTRTSPLPSIFEPPLCSRISRSSQAIVSAA